MIAAAPRRPGIAYAPAPPPPADVLPRMDIAGFAGFAERGPLDVPVAIEDERQFAAVFGDEPALAWDAARGEPVRGHLAAAVRAFFAAGGRRCWVVRVAGTPATARFAVPGLVRVRPSANRPVRLQPALLAAASPGSWADGLSVAASLLVSGLPVTELGKAVGGVRVALAGGAGERLARGDLLRIGFGAAARVQYAVVTATAADEVTARYGAWFARVDPAPATPCEARWPIAGGTLARAPARLDPDEAGGVRLRLSATVAEAPAMGSLVRVRLPGRRLVWIVAGESRDEGRDGTVVAANAAWRLAGGQALPAFDPLQDSVERLELELVAREDGGGERRAAALGLAPEHPRYAGALPDDAARFRALLDSASVGAAPGPGDAFPLAGDEPQAADEVLVPLGVEAVPSLWARAIRDPLGDAAPLQRDGLADLASVAFGDPRLEPLGVHALREHAASLRVSEAPPARGVHALLELDEVTVVACPDAVQPGWSPAAPPRVVPSDAPAPGPPQERATFRACADPRLAAPALERRASSPATVVLAWRLAGAPSGTRFNLERAARPDWSDAVPAYEGGETLLELHGLPPGVHRFRVRAEHGGSAGPWSRGVDVLVAVAPQWIAAPDEPAPRLARVHRSMVTLAAARGDILAVLALPRETAVRDAAAYVTALAGRLDEGARSYAAVYHPWPVAGGLGGVRAVPPDGAAAGVIAGCSLRAGSWTAPANVPLPGAVSLSPLLAPEEEQRLRSARLNVVVPTPRGIAWQSTDTLSADVDLRSIPVRRLLQLLRRIALRHGPTATFEPLGDQLRRTVRRDFEALLARLHRLGALRGATAAEAYRVEVSQPDGPGTGEGQLVVALKVAPSRPLVFLTVRLVVRGGRAAAVEEA